MALEANPDEDDWTVYLQGICDQYNSQKIPGTDVVRSSVDKSNYLSLVEKLYGSGQPDLLFNVSSGQNYSPKLGKLLWRYEVGQKVLLNRASNYTDKTGPFYKPSVKGFFSKRPYVIRRRVLKTSSDLFLCPVYSLQDLKGLHYEVDLLPFSPKDASAADEKHDPGGRRLGRLPHVVG